MICGGAPVLRMASTTSASIFTADMGTGSEASGSKNTGSSGPQSRPNFSRKRCRWPSKISRVRAAIASLVTRPIFLFLRRRLLGMAWAHQIGRCVPSLSHLLECTMTGRLEGTLQGREQVSRGGGNMPRERPNPKAPDNDILARAYLARGLSRHPDIAKHVERVADVEEMGMWALLTLAKKMGVDPDEMIRKTEVED